VNDFIFHAHHSQDTGLKYKVSFGKNNAHTVTLSLLSEVEYLQVNLSIVMLKDILKTALKDAGPIRIVEVFL